MAELLVEFYVSRSGASALCNDADRARRAAVQRAHVPAEQLSELG
jgi:hypothetical protein